MSIPTREEYEQALENRILLTNTLNLEYKRRDDLINKLCESQKLLESYKGALKYQKEIIDKFEIYEEIKNE